MQLTIGCVQKRVRFPRARKRASQIKHSLCVRKIMIYVREKDFDGQLKLLGFLASQDRYFLCAWLYPESRVSKVSGQPIENSNLESVTRYGDGTIPRHTSLANCTKELLQSLSSSQAEIVASCDSLALYKNGAITWFAAVVGHEGMCLVKDDAMLDEIMAAGFVASLKEPGWW
jgi:hypothetical protein